jgi:hypothetical protein
MTNPEDMWRTQTSPTTGILIPRTLTPTPKVQTTTPGTLRSENNMIENVTSITSTLVRDKECVNSVNRTANSRPSASQLIDNTNTSTLKNPYKRQKSTCNNKLQIGNGYMPQLFDNIQSTTELSRKRKINDLNIIGIDDLY